MDSTELSFELPRPAGIVFGSDGECTAACLTFRERPGTPESQAKWRQSTFNEAGKRVLHPGIFDDVRSMGLDQRIFGARLVESSDHVTDVMHHPGEASDTARIKLQRAEEIYRGQKREPLGKSYSRGHRLPEKTADPAFRFGTSSACPEGTEEVIFPSAAEELSEEARRQYIKSHMSYGPGEQRRRDYDWPKPLDSLVFPGDRVDHARNGASESIRNALQDDPSRQRSRISSKRLEDFRNLTDSLGRARNLAQGSRDALPADHAYGVASVRRGAEEWDAKQCIQGDYDEDDQAPDRDLGKTMTPGFRNLTTETRAFGVPSIRSDIPRYERKSLADQQNYGDDVSAQYLLYPGQFTNLGVEDEEFIKLREKAEIRDIFSHIDMDLNDENFEQVFAQAAAECDPTGEKASVDAYRNAYNAFVESA
mmetsp:Transcript_17367/g.66146  ORF Transcript_17367/g.66146 Transcript_17367/m.66146 type:complete len:423 (-) Transcript_17367:66-1334(-)|eukprot:scaffold447_cov307-Pinguiococcus_pyrenoidosus.AAC.82